MTDPAAQHTPAGMVEPGQLSPGSTGDTDGPLGRLILSRSAHDRAAHHRSALHFTDRLRAGSRTRVIELRGGRALTVPNGDGRTLHRGSPHQVDSDLWLYLGEHGHTPYLAAVSHHKAPEETGPDGERWLDLRAAADTLDDLDAGLFTSAVALANWHRTHQHCPRCGARTEPANAGWTRRCPVDDSEHYPRTDPAIIVAVVGRDDRILLGHNPAWPERRYSTLAGFVEPGECLEDAVRREVAEETGIVVGAVTYLGSQPWPFPASLMLGFVARAESDAIVVDAEEISDARWFSRQDIATLVPAGQLITPGGVSIARRLVEHWYGGPLPLGPGSW